MTQLSELLEAARRCRQSGDLERAEQLCRQILQLEPAHAQAWLFLGEVCERLGRRDEAGACYRQGLGTRPTSAALCTSLGVGLAQLGKVSDATVAFREAIRLEPGFPQAHHNLGVALAQQNRPDDAINSFREALRLKPDYAEAYYNLGNTLGQLGRSDEAITCYSNAIQRKPDYADALNNLGLALTERGQPGEAAIQLRQAVRLRPDLVQGHNNLGLALAELGRFDEAIASYEQALRLQPDYSEAHGNLGNAYTAKGYLEEAIACHDLALLLQPNYASAHWNRSLALLQAGKYELGWKEYEWRWKRKNAAPRPFRQPMWDGVPLDGRTILLWCEQGLGDAIQFVRYVKLVKESGGQIILECPGILTALFQTIPGVDKLVAEGEELPTFEVHAPLLSLPAIFCTTLNSVPRQVPYLTSDPTRVERWRTQLKVIEGFKVGIAWQGNPRHRYDRYRSIPVAQFARLAAVPGVRLVSLQKGQGTEQLSSLGGRFDVVDFGDELDQDSAFVDTAAIICNLDLVVTTDTATAHVAGALGAPVWLALSTVVDWRWLLNRDDTPWYPSMRLFRQQRLGDWEAVFERMATELTRNVGPKRVAESLLVAPIAPGELIDKLTILTIKSARIADADKQCHIKAEREALESVRRRIPDSEDLSRLAAELTRINETLWDVEDSLRLCEQTQDFGTQFVNLARSVYLHNDARAEVKRRINTLLGAAFAEQKSYSVSP
jgi:tetratricopeptide (TPR) repeat protein